MKKITKQKRKRCIRLTKKRTEKKNRRKRRRKLERVERSSFQSIPLPEYFDLTMEKDRNALLTSIKVIHDKVKENKFHIRLNFTDVQVVIASAMLLFWAEIQNLKNLYPRLVFRLQRPVNQRVAQVLEQLGIRRFCCAKKPQITPRHEDVVHWRSVSGIKTDGKTFDSVVGQSIALSKDVNLYGGFIEAIGNAKNHAYIEERKLSPVEKEKAIWWAFSQIKDGRLNVAVCDLGVGIPKTIPKQRKGLAGFVKSWFDSPTDAQYIASTITDIKSDEGLFESGKSRTGEDFRGTGLPQIAKIAENTEGASLRLFSLKGCVEIDFQRNQESPIKLREYATSINGTIVEWALPLGEDKNEKN